MKFKKELMRSALISVVAGLGLAAANAQTFQVVDREIRRFTFPPTAATHGHWW